MKEVKQKSLFSAVYFSEVNLTPVYTSEFEACAKQTGMPFMCWNLCHVSWSRAKYCLFTNTFKICHFDHSGMVRTSEYVGLRLFSFFQANFKISTAIREMSRPDGIKISRCQKVLNCFRQNSTIGNLPHSGRPPTITVLCKSNESEFRLLFLQIFADISLKISVVFRVA